MSLNRMRAVFRNLSDGVAEVFPWGAAAGLATYAGVRLLRTLRRYELRGKSVLITGGSRGLGLVLAREILAQGGRVAICARDREELQRAYRDLVRLGRVVASVCDITVEDEVARMVRRLRSELGDIDVLVNNAGIIQVGPYEMMTRADFEEVMRTHFWGPLNAITAVLPGMRRRRQGRIVNIASIGGKIAVPHLLPYSASKFALVGLSEGLRAELGRQDIWVTTVCPGLMRTGSPRHATFKGRAREEFAWFDIGSALPGLTTSAEWAARQIVAALRRGDAEVVLSLPAKVAALFHGMFPGLTCDLLGLVNRFLPPPGGSTDKREGKDCESEWAPSWLTKLSDQAAERNNEIAF